MIARISLAIICLWLTACIHSNSQYDAIVEATPNKTTRFKTVQAALDAAPGASSKPYKILIKPGNYFEKIIITKPNIHLIGSNKQSTRIFYNAYAGQQSTEAGATAGQIWGTTGSGTVIVRATDVQLHNITVENSFDFLSNDKLNADNPNRINSTQAVALHLDQGSDRFFASNINLLGYQDTLFVNSGRSWFNNSLIAGNVDFIFGKGNSVFTNSEIKSLARGKLYFPHGYLVAPSTQSSQDYGLTFIKCRLTRDASVPDNSVPLGRPWHPTTQFSDGRYADPGAIGKAIFIDSWMDKHITIDGWYSMNGTAKDGSKISFLPEDARFFEYKSHGPGAQINYKRRQLSDNEAKKYSLKNILGDWKI